MRSRRGIITVLLPLALLFSIPGCKPARGPGPGAGTAPSAKPAPPPVSVGLLGSPTWHLLSLFPFVQKEFAVENIVAGYVAPDVRSEDTFWQQIRQFNVLILQSGYYYSNIGAAQAGVLKRYLDAGGGIWIIGSDMNSDQWLKALPDCGIRIEKDRGLQDPVTKFGLYWWTRQMVPHAVTQGVRCLAYPKVSDYERVATQLMGFSPEWQVLVKGETSAHLFDVVQEHKGAFPSWKDLGPVTAPPPLLAVRSMGKGRLACLPMDPAFITFNIGNPGFPQVIMREGDPAQNPSDGWKLTVNLVRWLGEPAQAGGTVGGYQPGKDREVPKYPAAAPLAEPIGEAPIPTWFKGVAGLHSSLSDGKSTVAEYAKAAKGAGLDFIIFTDPWESLTEETLAQLKKQCAAASDDTFRAIAGIQYRDQHANRWVSIDPLFIPRKEYLTPDGKRVALDGMYAINNAPTHRLTRMILGAARLKADPRNMMWVHFMPIWEYRDGKPDGDNTKAFLKFVGDQRSMIPTAFTEITSAAELPGAANQAVMAIDGKDLAEAMDRMLPKVGTPWPLFGQFTTYASQGPSITQFTVLGSYSGGRPEFTRGYQYCRIAVGASSPAGLAEVTVLDNEGLIHRRFLAGGAKTFFRSWVGINDRQHSFVLMAKDIQGRMAISNPKLVFNNCRGIYYCGDNLNALQTQNCPFFHPSCYEFPGTPANWYPSFFGWRGWDGMQGMVRQAYVNAAAVSVQSEGQPEVNAGERLERVIETALPSYFCNVFKTKTTRVIGAFANENPKMASLGLPVRDTILTDQELVTTIPACRANLEYFWHQPRHADQSLAQYGGSLALVEGRLHFKRDVKLAGEGIPVANLTAWTQGFDAFYRFNPGPTNDVVVTSPLPGGFRDTVQPGGFVSAGRAIGHPFLANAGQTPLGVLVFADRKPGYVGACQLRLAEPGQKIAAGTDLSFRIVTGHVAEPDGSGRACRAVAEALNLGGGANGYPLSVTRGKLVDANFFLTLEADGREVRFKAGPRKMALDLPVRLKGIADNGCLAFYEQKLGHFVFVPAIDGEGLFQVAIDEGVEVWAGNPIVCDRSELKLALVGADEGTPRLEVHNPTDQELKAKLASPAGTPLLGGWQQELTVPAGDSMFLDLPVKKP